MSQQSYKAPKKRKLSTEARDLHDNLGADLSDYIYGEEFDQFKSRFAGRINPKEQNSLKNATELFGCLYKKNLIKIGDYEMMKEMLKNRNFPAYDLIVEAENNISKLK